MMYGKPITVVSNPAGTAGLRVILIEFDMYLDGEQTTLVIDQELTQVTDAVLLLLGTKTIEDIRRGSISMLRWEIAETVNETISSGVCFDVSIIQCVLQ